MTIDLEALRNQRQKELDQILATQGQDISALTPSTDRSFVQDALSMPQFAGRPIDQGSLRASISQQEPAFSRQQQQRTSQTRFNRQRSLQGILYEEAVNKAKQAGLSEQEAILYANKLIAQQQEQGFMAGESAKDRQAKLDFAHLQDIYAQKGTALQDQYANYQPDRTGALLRMILGTGAAVGTGYALNRASQPKSPTYPQPDYLTSQSMFTPRNPSNYGFKNPTFNRLKQKYNTDYGNPNIYG